MPICPVRGFINLLIRACTSAICYWINVGVFAHFIYRKRRTADPSFVAFCFWKETTIRLIRLIIAMATVKLTRSIVAKPIIRTVVVSFINHNHNRTDNENVLQLQ